MEVKNLSYEYPEKVLFSDISFNTADSPLVIIRGKNGSGKSTLLKVILGLLPARYGTVHLTEKMSYVPDSSEQYFVGMTPRILFHFLGKQYRISQAEFEEKLASLISLFTFSNKLFDHTIQNLSLGEKKKIMLIAAFLADSDLYLMDEPFSGLDTDSVTNLLQKINDDLNHGKQFIIVTHDSEEFLDNISGLILRIGEVHDNS